MKVKLYRSPAAAAAAAPAILARYSGNRKLGRRQTHALGCSQASCRDCDLLVTDPELQRDQAYKCYANNGLQQLSTTGRVNANAVTDPVRIARAVARLIDELTNSAARRLPLRLFTVGDSPSVRGTRAISKAVYRYLDSASSKGLASRSWGYTHAYRRVKHSDWTRRPDFSILASLSTLDAKTGEELPRRTIRGLFRAALRKGYKHFTIIVQSFPEHNQPIEIAGKRFLQCPYQVEALRAKAEHRTANGTIVCANCRGCMSSQLAKSGLDGVAFIPD